MRARPLHACSSSKHGWWALSCEIVSAAWCRRTAAAGLPVAESSGRRRCREYDGRQRAGTGAAQWPTTSPPATHMPRARAACSGGGEQATTACLPRGDVLACSHAAMHGATRSLARWFHAIASPPPAHGTAAPATRTVLSATTICASVAAHKVPAAGHHNSTPQGPRAIFVEPKRGTERCGGGVFWCKQGVAG